MMENTSPEKAETDELHHAMDRAKNAPSSENIHHLIILNKISISNFQSTFRELEFPEKLEF